MTSRSTDRPDHHGNHQPDHRSERPGKHRAQLATMTVRELLAALGKVEEELRDTPFLLPRDGIMVVNPRLAPLPGPVLAVRVEAGRPSAAWPPAPWVGDVP